MTAVQSTVIACLSRIWSVLVHRPSASERHRYWLVSMGAAAFAAPMMVVICLAAAGVMGLPDPWFQALRAAFGLTVALASYARVITWDGSRLVAGLTVVGLFIGFYLLSTDPGREMIYRITHLQLMQSSD